MNKQLKKIWKKIEELPHDELYKLLREYNSYVIEITDREDGSIPVCVPEYYENEYQEMKGR